MYLTLLGHQQAQCWLTHWGRGTHICFSRLTIIGSDNGLSPGRRQAIIWTNAGILLTGPLGTNFREKKKIVLTISFTKMHLIMSSATWRPFCLGLNVLKSHNWFLSMSHINAPLPCGLDDIIQSDQRDLDKYRGTSRVKNWCYNTQLGLTTVTLEWFIW